MVKSYPGGKREDLNGSGRDRYMGLCLHCLTETCVPMYRHTVEDTMGFTKKLKLGVVWTCWLCGHDMFWQVTKQVYNENRQYEWAHWRVDFLSGAQQRKYEKLGYIVLRHTGVWFQNVDTRTKKASRFGEVWSGLKVDWDDSILPFSGEMKTLPVEW